MDKENKEVVDKAYNNAFKDNKKKPFKKFNNKKPYYKKNNVEFIVNTILKVLTIAALVAIWYELYISNTIVFD